MAVRVVHRAVRQEVRSRRLVREMAAPGDPTCDADRDLRIILIPELSDISSFRLSTLDVTRHIGQDNPRTIRSN